ncbi:MAG: LysR substrate-binding domain-containing protein, partial [Myxococcota bacterium]
MIAASDEMLMETVPRLFERMQREAPAMGLNVRPRSIRSMEMLEVGELDLLLRLHGTVPSWAECAPVDVGRVVCLVRGDHPRVGEGLTLAEYQALPHVRISPQGFGSSATDRRLRELGIERDILVYTFSFATAPELVARTDAVLTLPEWVARVVAPRLGLRVLLPPFDIPGFQLDMIWHQGRDDAALAWFRDAFTEAAADVR